MVNKIDHIGIAVKSIEEQRYYYSELLGLGEPEIEIVEEQKVKTAMFPIGEVRIELLEATSLDSPVAKFIKKRGEGIHHIALQVDDVARQIKILKDRGLILIDEIPRQGTEGHLIAFIHPESTYGVLTELSQLI